MAAQTTLQLLTTLGIRMEDPGEDDFTATQKLTALNYSQLKTAQLLDISYLSELQELDGTNAMQDFSPHPPAIAFGDLSSSLLDGENSIIAIKDAAGDFCTKTTLSEQRRLDNTLLAADATNKVYYIFDEKIYVDVGGNVTDNVEVYFIQKPADMVSGGQAPILNEALYDIMLRFAGASLWRADDNLDRAEADYQEALDYVDLLNQLAEMKRPLGVGTKKSKREKLQR